MPNILYTLAPATSIPIYKAFNIEIGVTLNSLANNLKIEARSQLGVDFMPRIKLCSVLVIDSGEYVPCPNCLNYLTKLEPYSQNTASNVADAFVWSLDSLKMYKIRTNENPEVNTILLSVVGQVLDHTSNLPGSSVDVTLQIYSNNQLIENKIIPIQIGLSTTVILFIKNKT